MTKNKEQNNKIEEYFKKNNTDEKLRIFANLIIDRILEKQASKNGKLN
jgi:hypothetical protein